MEIEEKNDPDNFDNIADIISNKDLMKKVLKLHKDHKNSETSA